MNIGQTHGEFLPDSPFSSTSLLYKECLFLSHLNFRQPFGEFLPDSPLRAFLDISGEPSKGGKARETCRALGAGAKRSEETDDHVSE